MEDHVRWRHLLVSVTGLHVVTCWISHLAFLTGIDLVLVIHHISGILCDIGFLLGLVNIIV